MGKKVHCYFILFFVFIYGCGEKETTAENSEDSSELFADYQQFKLGINPIEATKGGYAAYNDTIANYVSESYQNHLFNQYDSFLNRIERVDVNALTEYASRIISTVAGQPP